MSETSETTHEHAQTIIPHLVVRGAAEAIEFYKKAFGFEERMRMPTPDGKVLHGELRLGSSVLFIADEFPGAGAGGCRSPQALGGTSITLHINSPDVDAAFARAVAAGAKVTMPVADMFWGDRYGMVVDPFGHAWSIATHKEDVSPEEASRRAEEMFSKWKK